MLANTYHLLLRPGPEVVAELGGLHEFCRWPGASCLPTQGGFKRTRLRQPAPSGTQRPLVKQAEEGFLFKSHLDGTLYSLTVERAVEVQGPLGADVQMQLDVCPPANAPREVVEEAVMRTTRWARRALSARRGPERQALFGIVQGGCFVDLRIGHAAELAALAFDGLALGGFSVGEPIDRMHETLRTIGPRLDPERPRYLMGVGTPRDLVAAIGAGIDMFDCVLPTRNGRNGQAFTRTGRIVIKQAQWRQDPTAPRRPMHLPMLRARVLTRVPASSLHGRRDPVLTAPVASQPALLRSADAGSQESDRSSAVRSLGARNPRTNGRESLRGSAWGPVDCARSAGPSNLPSRQSRMSSDEKRPLGKDLAPAKARIATGARRSPARRRSGPLLRRRFYRSSSRVGRSAR